MKYVWVAGISRSGKRTLIEKLVGEGKELQQELGIEPPVSALEASIDDPPRSFTIEDIIGEVERKQLNTLFIKWQFRNARKGHVRKLIERQPTSEHMVLLVERSLEDTLKEWRNGQRRYQSGISDEQRRAALDNEIAEIHRHLIEAELPPNLQVRRIRNQSTGFELAP